LALNDTSIQKDSDGMSNPISRWLSSDVGYSFRQSKTAMVAAFIAFVFIFCALFAKWVAPYNPFDAASLELTLLLVSQLVLLRLSSL